MDNFKRENCPHFEYNGGCWDENGNRKCSEGCKCLCHHTIYPRIWMVIESERISLPEYLDIENLDTGKVNKYKYESVHYTETTKRLCYKLVGYVD